MVTSGVVADSTEENILRIAIAFTLPYPWIVCDKLFLGRIIAANDQIMPLRPGLGKVGIV